MPGKKKGRKVSGRGKKKPNINDISFKSETNLTRITNLGSLASGVLTILGSSKLRSKNASLGAAAPSLANKTLSLFSRNAGGDANANRTFETPS